MMISKNLQQTTIMIKKIEMKHTKNINSNI